MSKLYARVVSGEFTHIRYTASDLRYRNTISQIINEGDSILPILESLVNLGTTNYPKYRAPSHLEYMNQIRNKGDLNEGHSDSPLVIPPDGITELLELLADDSVTSELLDTHAKTPDGERDLCIMNTIPDYLLSQIKVKNAILGSTRFLELLLDNSMLSERILNKASYIYDMINSANVVNMVLSSPAHRQLITMGIWDRWLTSDVYAQGLTNRLIPLKDIFSTLDNRRRAFELGGSRLANILLSEGTASREYLINECSYTDTFYSKKVITISKTPAYLIDMVLSRTSTSGYVRIYGILPKSESDPTEYYMRYSRIDLNNLASVVKLSCSKNNRRCTATLRYISMG